MRKTKSTDLKSFEPQLRAFCVFIDRKSGVTESRFRRKLISYGILNWEAFIQMPESQFKAMFERKFRIKLVRWIREFYENPVLLYKKRIAHRQVKFNGRKIDVCKK